MEIPYGEKVAYKYVVDGQWMTREDEAKEWGECVCGFRTEGS